MNKIEKKIGERLLSLDFFRGLTMFLLIAEFAGIFPYLVAPAFEGTLVHFIGTQLRHVDWVGLHFWDLIQPFFMFIVGVAMPLSFSKRLSIGNSYKQLTNHAIKRSLIMLLLGWGLYCIEAGQIVFRFQNVLAQLSVTYLLAFFIIQKPAYIQLVFSFFLIILSEGLYRFFPVEGFTHAFVGGENFGTWFNLLVSGERGGGDWAIFNAIPTAAHTIWGVMAGQLLLKDYSERKKLVILFTAGVIGLVVGYSLASFTPIIKRIATSTFVLTSGGWTLIVLAFCYWVIDIMKYKKGVLFFAVVGMNPLFIYLFAHIGGANLIKRTYLPFSNAFFGWTGEVWSQIILGIFVLATLWYICYWLYKRRIFIRI